MAQPVKLMTVSNLEYWEAEIRTSIFAASKAVNDRPDAEIEAFEKIMSMARAWSMEKVGDI